MPSSNAKKNIAARGAFDADPVPVSSSCGGLREKTCQATPENLAFMAGLAAQAAEAREKNLRNGLLLTSAELGGRLHITQQAISKAVEEYRMFSLDGASGIPLYPAFFSDPAFDRRSIERVSQALGDLPGPSKWQFFTTKKGSLDGRTPLRALAQGQIERVLVAAAGFKER
jgi:hypothetical protein